MRPVPLHCFALAAALPAFSATLVVRNVSVIDSARQQTAFEVVNESANAIRSWTMTVTAKKQPPKGDTHFANPYEARMMTTSQACSRTPGALLRPGESCRCEVSLYSGEPAMVSSAAVTVTSVLFEDGSAEGDVTLLDNIARQRRSMQRFLEHAIAQLEPALAAATAREQLEAMRKILSAPAASLPPDLQYDATAAREVESLVAQVGWSMRMLDSPQIKDPRAQAAGLVQSLKQRLEHIRSVPDPFPPRIGAELGGTAGDPLQGWKVMSRTGALQLVAVRESATPTAGSTLFLRNVSPKPVTAFALAFGEGAARGGTTVDFFSFQPESLLPGATHSYLAGASSERTLQVNAVIFDDGTAEGVQSTIDSIKFNRLGRIFETERIRTLVERPDADFATLPTKLGPVPESPESAFAALENVNLPGISLDRIRTADSQLRFFFFNGVRLARDTVLRRIGDTGRPEATPQASLEDIRRELRDRSAVQRAYCERIYAK